jgi:hypothetical protein
MSLLPPAMRLNDDSLSLPLGPAIPKAIQVKVDPIKEFETGVHPDPDGRYTHHVKIFSTAALTSCITDSTTLATGSALIGLKQATPAAPPHQFKPGDRVRAIQNFGSWHAIDDTGTVLRVWGDFGQSVDIDFDASSTTRAYLKECGTSTESRFLELIESSPSTPPVEGEWVTHDGVNNFGICPVPAGTMVQLRFQSGNVSEPLLASRVMWSATTAAYRVVKQ